MTNTVSEASDKDGLAVFKNLTITGSFGLSAYIMIAVDGIVQVWTTKYNPSGVDYPLPPRGLMPVLIENQDLTIELVDDFPFEVTEGKGLDTPPKIRVLDSVGDPKAGVQCYSGISSQSPLGYT